MLDRTFGTALLTLVNFLWMWVLLKYFGIQSVDFLQVCLFAVVSAATEELLSPIMSDDDRGLLIIKSSSLFVVLLIMATIASSR